MSYCIVLCNCVCVYVNVLCVYVCIYYVLIVSLVAFLAQSVERAALNRAVVGSRPTGGVDFYDEYIFMKNIFSDEYMVWYE